MTIHRRGRWSVEDFSQHDEIHRAFDEAQQKANELNRPVEITPCTYIAEPNERPVVEVFEGTPNTIGVTYTLRVDPVNGDDSNTYAQVSSDPDNVAWRTFYRALTGLPITSWASGSPSNPSQAAQAGDTVLIEPGSELVDRGGVNTPTTYCCPSYYPVNSGTAANPIRFVCRHKAAFLSDGQDALRFKIGHTNGAGFLFDMGADYVYYDGFYIEESLSSIGTDDGYMLLRGGTNRGGMVNCDLKGLPDGSNTYGAPSYNHALFFTTSTSYNTEFLFCNNKVRRHYPVNGHHHNFAAIILYDQRDMYILHNEFSEMDSSAIFIKGTTPPYVGNVSPIAFNKFSGAMQEQAITFYNYGYQNPVDDFLVYQNLFIDCGAAQMAAWELNANLRGQGVTFVNNTMDYSNYAGVLYGTEARAVWYFRTCANHRNRNNLITNIAAGSNLGGAMYAGDYDEVDNVSLAMFQAESDFEFDRNFYANINGGNPINVGLSDRTLSYWQDGGAGFDVNGVYQSSATGIYNNLAGGDFSLAAGSPAKTSQGGPGQDYLQRLGGATTAGIDVGAYITGVNEVPGLQEGYDYSWHYNNQAIPRDNG